MSKGKQPLIVAVYLSVLPRGKGGVKIKAIQRGSTADLFNPFQKQTFQDFSVSSKRWSKGDCPKFITLQNYDRDITIKVSHRGRLCILSTVNVFRTGITLPGRSEASQAVLTTAA